MSHHALYAAHVRHRRDRLDHLLNETGFDVLFIHSGRVGYPKFDDRALPFRAHGHFSAWLPLPFAPDCLLECHAGQQPILWYLQADDFWHLPPAEPERWWADEFDVRIIKDPSDWVARINRVEATAAIGDEAHLAGLGEHMAINPPRLMQALDEDRTQKTAYECALIFEANRKAARGHQRAGEAFVAGHSELEIFQAYIQGVNDDPATFPYDGIVALNEHAATLHYQHRQTDRPDQARSFLLDAGADQLGYASDITRTHAATTASHAGGVFQGLIDAMDHLQRRLCQGAKVGHSFVDLHHQAHRGIAEILMQSGLATGSAEALVDQGITRTFFPHGLGHFLGAQVHDVAGLVAPDGTPAPAPAADPMLRLTRVLEPGHVVTIEPGLYFIPMLLADLKQTPQGASMDWALVEALTPFGGIRVEDNIHITDAGPVNFTREAFDAID